MGELVEEQEDNHAADKARDSAPRPDAPGEYSHEEEPSETAGQETEEEVELIPQRCDVKCRQSHRHQDTKDSDDNAGNTRKAHLFPVGTVFTDLGIEIFAHDRRGGIDIG